MVCKRKKTPCLFRRSEPLLETLVPRGSILAPDRHEIGASVDRTRVQPERRELLVRQRSDRLVRMYALVADDDVLLAHDNDGRLVHPGGAATGFRTVGP